MSLWKKSGVSVFAAVMLTACATASPKADNSENVAVSKPDWSIVIHGGAVLAVLDTWSEQVRK